MNVMLQRDNIKMLFLKAPSRYDHLVTGLLFRVARLELQLQPETEAIYS
jgi:hypothetical protein